MKKAIYLSFLLMFSLACDENLDIDSPSGIPPENLLTDGDNLRPLILGAYKFLGTQLQGNIQVATELLANDGDLIYLGNFIQFRQFDAKQVVPTNSFLRGYWPNPYRSVNLCNIVLNNLDLIQDAATRDLIEGEAKFLRAVSYFEMVRIFALPYEAERNNDQLGLPLMFEGVVDASQIAYPSRQSVEQVYAQVITDLQEAANLLPGNNFELADRYAALALLARVYLQQGDYTGALQASHEVLANSGHILAANLESAFNNETDGIEDVFMWQVTTQDQDNRFNDYWATVTYGGRSSTADISVLNPFFEIFNGPDDRADFFYEGNGTVVSSKWTAQFANVPYIRVAEMHLIRAESNFRLNSSVGRSPQEDVNIIRARSNAPPLNNLTLEDILLERKRELAFEGFTLHDAKRQKQSIGEIPYDADRLVLPIPQDELDSNPNLEPNPGNNN